MLLKISLYSIRLQSFQRKHDILAAVLIFDARGMQDSGPGYRHPQRDCDHSEDFSMIVSIPQVKNVLVFS